MTLTEPNNWMQDNTSQMTTLDELYADAASRLLSPLPGIKTAHWPMFNLITGGLRPKEYSIICGPTGAGKTTWLANLSAQLLLQQEKHFVASVETGPIDYIARIMSAFARFDMNTGDKVPLERLKKLHSDYESIWRSQNLILSLYENRISCSQLLADLFVAHDKHGCKVAILDNLNFFLEITSAQNERIEMDRVTHELVMFCKQVNMHVIMVMHPKKTDHGRVLSEFDIKGSSTAVQEAHNVFLLNRPSPEQEDMGFKRTQFRELTFRKLRRRGGYEGARIMLQNEGSYYIENAAYDTYNQILKPL